MYIFKLLYRDQNLFNYFNILDQLIYIEEITMLI
jgi:hypothetical protein